MTEEIAKTTANQNFGMLVQYRSTFEHLFTAPIGSPQQAEYETSILDTVVKARKAIEAQKDELYKPAKETVDTAKKTADKIRGFFKGPIKYCSDIEDMIKTRLVSWKRAAEASAAQALVYAPPELVQQTVEAVTQEIKGLTIRRVWSWEVIDQSQIPREFLILDVKKLDEWAKTHKGNLNIPGIRPIEKEIPAYRSQ